MGKLAAGLMAVYTTAAWLGSTASKLSAEARAVWAVRAVRARMLSPEVMLLMPKGIVWVGSVGVARRR